MLAEQVVWVRGFVPERDIILAGDFNDPDSHEAMRGMAETAGLRQLDAVPLSTFKTDGSGYASAYDHMYVWESDTRECMVGTCDTLDETKPVYGNREPAKTKKARSELSDHRPGFAVFDVSGEDDD